MLILLIESAKKNAIAAVTDVEKVDVPRALGIGIAQAAALIPGVSRSASTLMGGLLAGLDRPTALRFSFYLAIPTLLAATGYDMLRSLKTIPTNMLSVFAVGLIAAFVVGLLVVRFFLGYVSQHSLKPFAWYRIALGGVILAWSALHR